jgi:hypothetical protein
MNNLLTYKEFVLYHKKLNGYTPNQLEIEKLYENYNSKLKSKSDSDLNLNSVNKEETSSISKNTLNNLIQNNNIDDVKKAIELKIPFTENTIYFAIKTNNFELFKCVYEYVKIISENDLKMIKLCKNEQIIEFISKQSSKESESKDIENSKLKDIIGKELLNAINGLTKSKGGLNLPEFIKEIVKLFPEERHIINKMNRNLLEKYCKDYISKHNKDMS